MPAKYGAWIATSDFKILLSNLEANSNLRTPLVPISTALQAKPSSTGCTIYFAISSSESSEIASQIAWMVASCSALITVECPGFIAYISLRTSGSFSILWRFTTIKKFSVNVPRVWTVVSAFKLFAIVIEVMYQAI